MKRPTLPRSAHHYGLHPDTLVVHPDYAHLAPFLRSLPQRMARGEGEVIHRGRNELRIMHYDGLDLVVKAFHRPHVSNRFVYGTLRASKAKRSYANACLLLDLGIGTPQPVGYYNVRSTLGLAFDKSYFVTLRSVCTHRYEEFFEHDMPEMPDVLRALGHITARLHEAATTRTASCASNWWTSTAWRTVRSTSMPAAKTLNACRLRPRCTASWPRPTPPTAASTPTSASA